LSIPERPKDHSQFWAPDEDFKFEDFNIDIDRPDITELKAATRESAGKLREQVRKEYAKDRDSLLKAREEFDRQLKPQLDQMRRSVEEMRRELQKTFHEL
jgi:hypothetical protein